MEEVLLDAAKGVINQGGTCAVLGVMCFGQFYVIKFLYDQHIDCLKCLSRERKRG